MSEDTGPSQHGMVTKARRNAEKVGTTNVEFRLGEIEHLPIADNSADIIMSNCVINLSPDKLSVYREAYRVLKPGGRLAISDIVTTATLPQKIQEDLALVAACVGGAATIDDTKALLKEAGFNGEGVVVSFWMGATMLALASLSEMLRVMPVL